MKKIFFSLAIVASVFMFPMMTHATTSDIFITEVFSNPEGSDTGFELITMQNNGAENISLAGWTLYPDGVGYYTFPDVTINGGKSIAVRLRTSGTNSAGTLYHASATGNMGNTSGSVAIFSSATRDEATIIDFIQYGKSGETWESTAEKAGLWVKGSYVALDSTQEGYSIKRKNFEHTVSAWEFSTYVENSNSASTGSSATDVQEEDGAFGNGGRVYSGPTNQEKIRAYAGGDITSIAGTETEFTGKALGFEDDILASEHIRYLWNFGDGVILEGKKIMHDYRFPGTYIATLMVVQGEESFRDDVKVVIHKNPVIMSGVNMSDGWIQLFNPSGSRVDISNWSIIAGGKTLFRFPAGTLIAERGKATFNIAFPSGASLPALHYSNGEFAAGYTPGVKVSEEKKVVTDKALDMEHAPMTPIAIENKARVEENVVSQSDPMVREAVDERFPMGFGASVTGAGISHSMALTVSILSGVFVGLILFIMRSRPKRQKL